MRGFGRGLLAGVVLVVLIVVIFVWKPWAQGSSTGLTNCGSGVYVQQGQSCPNGGGNVPVSSTTGANPVSPTNPPTTTGNTSGDCSGGRNYQMPSTLSGNVYFRVEFYSQGGSEYESWLSPGTWSVSSGINGWVWEFPASCSESDIRADANSAHNRRGNAGVLDPSDSKVTAAFTKQ